MPPTTLQGWVGAPAQTPLAIVKINGTAIQNIVSVDVSMGVGQQSSTANARMVADQYPSWAIRSTFEVRMGYAGQGGNTQLVFLGEIEDVDTRYVPFFIEIKAAGYLKRAQRNAGNTDPFSASTAP